jgi:hypothetical protein
VAPRLFDPTDPAACQVEAHIMPPQIVGGDPDAIVGILVTTPGVIDERWHVEVQVHPRIDRLYPDEIMAEVAERLRRLAEGNGHEDHWGERVDAEYRHEGWQIALYVDEAGLFDLDPAELAPL